MTVVLPVPAPATIRSGPALCKTALSCSGFKFSIKLFENNGYGAIQVEGRERVSVDNLDVVVINRNPYKVLFSGSFIYYDNQSQSIKTVMLTEGQIFEK